MTIQGGADQRTQVANVTAGNFANVVAVDSLTGGGGFLPGSGYLIGPQHVLTAGHVVSTGTATAGVVANSRITTSGNVAGLPSRANPASAIPPASFNTVGGANFVDNYNGSLATDIALLTTTNSLTTSGAVLGLVTFLDVEDARTLPITTAGYPWSITQPLLSVNADPTGRTMYVSSGTVANTNSNGQFVYSNTVDTEGGQSGSGVWINSAALGASSVLASATSDLLIGVHTNGGGNGNGGQLIEKTSYDAIVAQMLATAGSPAAAAQSAAQLPENAIVGTTKGFFSFFSGSGNDFIAGSYRKELLVGQNGDDLLLGAGGDDRLEGGDGVDQALFSGLFSEYDFTITNPTNPAFEFNHVRGSQADGKDTTRDIEFGVFEFVDGSDADTDDDDGNLFFVPLQVDPGDNTKLKDGPTITPEKDILNGDSDKIGTLTVESPAWMFDGDVDYTLTIGSEQSILYNFAYIIDVSGSMRGTPLAQAQNAYQALTQSLIDDGVAANSQFGIVPFNSSASLTGPVDAPAAISTINGLSAGGGTSFGPALAQAGTFFAGQSNNATNIAYFLSDGQGSGASASLQSVAEVRAFGIGNADLSTLNIIDSDSAVLLSNPADLVTEFNASRVDRDTIERIDVKVGGTVVDTIDPSQLNEDTLGLTFEGSLDNLEVTRDAENEIVFDLVFNDGTPTTSLEYKITTGQEQVTDQTDDGGKVVVVFSVNQSDFVGSAESEEIIGNDLSNVIDGGSGDNTLLGNGGNDIFILSGGVNLVDGGDGIDTVKINQTQQAAGGVTKNGSVVNIGADNSLVNVEYVEFSDVRLSLDTLSVVPIISLADQAISLTEGDNGTSIATFQVNLSSVTTEEVTIDFATRSTAATVGEDYSAAVGQLVIAAGETSGTIAVEILGDQVVEGNEAVFLDLSAVSGGTFAQGASTLTTGVNIVDDDTAIVVPITADDPTVIEGSPDTASTLTITLNRFGGLTGSDTVTVEVVAAGDNPAQADDFVNGFTTQQVTFAPDEATKTVDIAIAPDQTVEPNETFGIRLTSVSGSASIPSEDIIYTIINDDVAPINPVPSVDGKLATAYVDSEGKIAGRAFQSGEIYSGDLFTNTDASDGISPDDVVKGTDGNDNIWTGTEGSDLVDSGVGDDIVGFGPGDSKVIAGSGDDFAYAIGAGSGDNEVDLGAGEDNFYAASGNNRVTGSGNNTVGIGSGNDTVTTFAGDDFVYSIDGGGGTNTLNLGDGKNTIWLEKGDYAITTGAGDDSIGLGSGTDTVNAGNGDNVIYLANTIDAAGAKDILTGTGNDYIQTGAGDDLLDGGTGTNTLLGGMGADTFVLRQNAYNDVQDFELGIDKLELEGLTASDLRFVQGAGDVFLFIGDSNQSIGGITDVTVSEISDSTNFV